MVVMPGIGRGRVRDTVHPNNRGFERAMQQPWEQRETESQQAFEAFTVYRDAGVGRSLEIVRQRLGKSKALMERWSTRHGWVDRTREYEQHLDTISRASREKAIQKQSRRIMTSDEVKENLTFIAESDIADVFESDGSFDLAEARKRGTSKLIKKLDFDKDTGRVTKLETYSSHEALRDVGKTHGIFVDKTEQEVNLTDADLSRIGEQLLQTMMEAAARKRAEMNSGLLN